MRSAIDEKEKDNIEEEIGDVLFSIVNLSRFFDVSAEEALRKTVSKFQARFSEMARRLAERGRSLQDASLEEMESIWVQIKKQE